MALDLIEMSSVYLPNSGGGSEQLKVVFRVRDGGTWLADPATTFTGVGASFDVDIRDESGTALVSFAETDFSAVGGQTQHMTALKTTTALAGGAIVCIEVNADDGSSTLDSFFSFPVAKSTS